MSFRCASRQILFSYNRVQLVRSLMFSLFQVFMLSYASLPEQWFHIYRTGMKVVSIFSSTACFPKCLSCFLMVLLRVI